MVYLGASRAIHVIRMVDYGRATKGGLYVLNFIEKNHNSNILGGNVCSLPLFIFSKHIYEVYKTEKTKCVRLFLVAKTEKNGAFC